MTMNEMTLEDAKNRIEFLEKALNEAYEVSCADRDSPFGKAIYAPNYCAWLKEQKAK